MLYVCTTTNVVTTTANAVTTTANAVTTVAYTKIITHNPHVAADPFTVVESQIQDGLRTHNARNRHYNSHVKNTQTQKSFHHQNYAV